MNKSIFDLLTRLRDDSDSAETASANETGVAFNVVPFHPDNIENHQYVLKAVFHNIVVGGTADPAGVAFVIDVDSETAFGDSPVEVARITIPDPSNLPATTLEIPLNLDMIGDMDPDAAAIRCGVEITGGTAPTVSYGCYLTKA